MSQPPFYSNTSDDLQCYQAALRMVLNHFMPEMEFTFEQLDQMTNMQPGKWTWPHAGLLSLMDMGFKVVIIDHFDYERFVRDRKEYLVELYGREIAEEQIKTQICQAQLKKFRNFSVTRYPLKVNQAWSC